MQIKNLSMSFGTQELFSNVNLYVPDNEKVGIVGVNGAGKSTFLKIANNIITPDEGKVVFKNGSRVGYLPQVLDEEVPSLDITVFDYLMQGRPIEKLNNELASLYEKLALTEEIDIIYKQIDKINLKLDYYEAYSAESTLLKIIDGMKIDTSLLDQSLNSLSGGEKSKVAFARLLYSMPEVILLDEPTNHLDINTKDYVTNYIKNYKGSVYVISHDSVFLDAVTTKTLFLDKRTKSITLYDGNYSNFKKLYSEYEKALKRQAIKDSLEEERLKNFITKYSSASGKRKKMVQDREKKLEKLLKDKVEFGPNIKTAKVDMVMDRESTNIPISVNNLSFSYDKVNKIIDDLSFNILKGEKFLIVGENGVGKSTLLKLIVGELKPDSGETIIGVRTDLGYYAQEHELLDNDKTIIDNFSDFDISIKDLRNTLGRFLFYGDDVYKKISVLSPGERSRVALAKLSLSGSNLLVLDEPTNHLDPETQEIIADTFKTFKGSMLLVSHNPSFVDNLGIERVLILPSGKIDYYSRELVEHYQRLNSTK